MVINTPSPKTVVRIFNSNGKCLGTKIGQTVEFDLAPGLYEAQWDLDGIRETIVFRFPTRQTLNIPISPSPIDKDKKKL